jgi:hypothetical protein
MLEVVEAADLAEALVAPVDQVLGVVEVLALHQLEMSQGAPEQPILDQVVEAVAVMEQVTQDMMAGAVATVL